VRCHHSSALRHIRRNAIHSRTIGHCLRASWEIGTLFDAAADFVLICDYTGKEVAE
jgi:hypothetical protein